MIGVIFFFVGATFGGCVGVFMMCLVGINRIDDDNGREEKERENPPRRY